MKLKDASPGNIVTCDMLRIIPRRTHLLNTVNHVQLNSKNSLRSTVIHVQNSQTLMNSTKLQNKS